MDRLRFDELARLLATTGSRRRTLGALLGAAVFGHAADLEAKPGKGKGKRRQGRSKARGGGKGRQPHNRSRRQAPRRIQTQQEDCWPGVRCFPKKGSNVSKCNFEDSTVFADLDCTRCNLSYANLTDADASGANFTRANLSYACLVDANFTDAIIAGTTNLSHAIFCRTTMPNGNVNNSGCNNGTDCCPTCIDLGNACGSGIAGSCCGGAACDGSTCQCPDDMNICADGSCRECCDDSACGMGFCCNGTCANCCDDADCRDRACQTSRCVNRTCVLTDKPDLTVCSPEPGVEGVCCAGNCNTVECCNNAQCTGGRIPATRTASVSAASILHAPRKDSPLHAAAAATTRSALIRTLARSIAGPAAPPVRKVSGVVGEAAPFSRPIPTIAANADSCVVPGRTAASMAVACRSPPRRVTSRRWGRAFIR